jgi:hypothetical protein
VGAGVKYSEVRHREEVEQSKFVFNQGLDLAEGEFGAFHRRMFDEYYKMAEWLLKANLVWPALEHTLKCSHIFNILDSSNSIGVTERTAYILRVRKLAVAIAHAYVGDGREGRGAILTMERELLLEIGCEEIPASWLPSLTTAVGEMVVAQLKEHRMAPDVPAETYSTPRRLTVRIAHVPERQTDLEEVLNGPPVSAAFKPDGTPTAAAAGFAAKNGVEVTALERVQTPKGRVPGVPQAPARQGRRGRLALGARRCVA